MRKALAPAQRGLTRYDRARLRRALRHTEDVHRLRRLPEGAVFLFEDETFLRQFPPLRAAWAPRGEQARVPITGENAKRVLFGALNPLTGHRIVLQRPSLRQEDFQAFLRLLRAHYPGRPLFLLLDKAGCHTAARTLQLAAHLDIHLLWLPKQWSELNAMDHLWRGCKQHVAANRQYPTVDAQAQDAPTEVRAASTRSTHA